MITINIDLNKTGNFVNDLYDDIKVLYRQGIINSEGLAILAELLTEFAARKKEEEGCK